MVPTVSSISRSARAAVRARSSTGAVIDHYGGKDTRVFREVTETGEALLDLAQIAGSTTKAQAAILHDCESRWAMEDAQGPRNMGLHYMNTVKKYMAVFGNWV